MLTMWNATDFPREFLKRLGYMWYIMDPTEHMFDKVEDVPDYYKEIIPAYVALSILELFVTSFLQRKFSMRLNDTITNISTGILMELTKVPIRGFELLVYTWVYNNWRIYTMPWDSVWTWLFTLVVSDLCFYWTHRAAHQISIFWVLHQTHHSSEEYNMTIPFRLNIFHATTLWITYIPLALAVPPPIYLVHFQMTVIFQFWLHTKVIKSCGFIEYIFVTPSHHRVHHGRNRRCIDKNFGSVFIFWDKIFGTFEPEGDKSISYGVTKPLQSFSPFAVMFDHLQVIWQRFQTVEGFSNKLACFFKGPGWTPGKPWLGDVEDIPEPKEDEPKYDPQAPQWLKCYVVVHAVAMILGHFLVIFNLARLSTFTFTISASYIAFTAICIACLQDLSVWGPALELIRCFLYFSLDAAIEEEFGTGSDFLNSALYCYRCLFSISSVFWIFSSPYSVEMGLPKLIN